MTGRRGLARARREVMLYDAHSQPFNASATVSAWRGGAESRRSQSWIVSEAAINALLPGDVAELRRRSRDIIRKNPMAASAQASFTANCVGNGIVPRPLTEDDDVRRELMEAWDEWVEQADADGTCDFYGLQALVCNSFREGGDCFVRLRARDPRDMARRGLCLSLQLQVLEAELLDPSFDELGPNGRRIQAGIEFDATNTRTAYHMWPEHPGDFVTRRNFQRVAVPAQNVLHVFEVQRPGQIRGVPGLATVLALLWELGKYDDAEVLRKQIAAMYAGFVTKPAGSLGPLDDDDDDEDEDGRPLVTLKPGTVQELEPGQEMVFSQPADVGASYEPFTRSQYRQVAAGGGVTYEQMTGDLSGVNYSSIRAGAIEHRLRMQQKQRNILIFQFCRPVWRRFVESAVLCGRVALPQDPRALRDLTRVAWTATPGREYVDPEKEVKATIARIRAGLISRSKAVAEHGFDAEALDREIAADNARADSLRLRFDTDGRFPVSGAAPAQLPAPSSGSASDATRPADAPEESDEDEGGQAAVDPLAVFRGLSGRAPARAMLEA